MCIVIGKADNFISSCFQPCCSCCIVFFLIWLGMRVAIDFNDKFCFCAIKVSDKSPNGMLAANLESQTAIPHACPYLCFCWRKRMTMIARKAEDGWNDLKCCFVLHGLGFSFRPHPNPLPSGEGERTPFSRREKGRG